MGETAHLRGDYHESKMSTITVCGMEIPEPDVFAHPEDVTCANCLDAACHQVAADVIRRHRMVPYSDGKGGYLFRGATPDELATALADAGLLSVRDGLAQTPTCCEAADGNVTHCPNHRQWSAERVRDQ